jgi:hypothetical protein
MTPKFRKAKQQDEHLFMKRMQPQYSFYVEKTRLVSKRKLEEHKSTIFLFSPLNGTPLMQYNACKT